MVTLLFCHQTSNHLLLISITLQNANYTLYSILPQQMPVNSYVLYEIMQWSCKCNLNILTATNIHHSAIRLHWQSSLMVCAQFFFFWWQGKYPVNCPGKITQVTLAKFNALPASLSRGIHMLIMLTEKLISESFRHIKAAFLGQALTWNMMPIYKYGSSSPFLYCNHWLATARGSLTLRGSNFFRKHVPPGPHFFYSRFKFFRVTYFEKKWANNF